MGGAGGRLRGGKYYYLPGRSVLGVSGVARDAEPRRGTLTVGAEELRVSGRSWGRDVYRLGIWATCTIPPIVRADIACACVAEAAGVQEVGARSVAS